MTSLVFAENKERFVPQMCLNRFEFLYILRHTYSFSSNPFEPKRTDIRCVFRGLGVPKVVPPDGIEPPTFGLQNRCSTS